MPVLPSLTCGFVDSTLQRSKTPGVNHLRDTKRLSIHSLAACLTSAGRSRDAKHSWYVHSRLQSHICLFSICIALLGPILRQTLTSLFDDLCEVRQ